MTKVTSVQSKMGEPKRTIGRHIDQAGWCRALRYSSRTDLNAAWSNAAHICQSEIKLSLSVIRDADVLDQAQPLFLVGLNVHKK